MWDARNRSQHCQKPLRHLLLSTSTLVAGSAPAGKRCHPGWIPLRFGESALKYQSDQIPSSSSARSVPDPGWLWHHHPDHAEPAAGVHTCRRSAGLSSGTATSRAGALQLSDRFMLPMEELSTVPIRGSSISPAQRGKNQCYLRITLLKLFLIHYLIFITVYHGLSKVSEVLGFKNLPTTRTRASPQEYQSQGSQLVLVLISASF